MTELKTLKDIISPTNDWQEASEKHIYEDLKREAIKWVRHLESKGKEKYKENFVPMNFVRHFFNITEEDIQEVKE